MGRSTQPFTPSSGHPSVQLRIELLERRCAQLWAGEPRSSANRETALARLAALEHRVGAAGLRRVAQPDDHDVVAAVGQCERDLDELAALWAAPRAA
jgi:hypothetical protein